MLEGDGESEGEIAEGRGEREEMSGVERVGVGVSVGDGDTGVGDTEALSGIGEGIGKLAAGAAMTLAALGTVLVVPFGKKPTTKGDITSGSPVKALFVQRTENGSSEASVDLARRQS